MDINARKLFSFIKNRIAFIFWGIPAVLFILILGVMFSECVACIMGDLLGTIDEKGKVDKKETITFLAFGMGGLLTAWGAWALIQRAKAVDDGNIQDRFKAAAEHLGSNQTWARAAAFYELYHFAKDNKETEKSVFNILCSHIRQITTASNYYGKYRGRPTEEIQDLLELLFTKRIGIEYGC